MNNGNIFLSPSFSTPSRVTLFDDPEDDLFDGRIGDDDQEWPRVLVRLEIKPEQTVIQNSEAILEKTDLEASTGRKEQADHRVSTRYDHTIQNDTHSESKIEGYPPICEQVDEDFRIQIVKTNEFDKDFKDSVFEQTISLNQTPNSCGGKDVGLLGKDNRRDTGKEERLTMSPASPISIHDSRNMSQINETFAKNVYYYDTSWV